MGGLSSCKGVSSPLTPAFEEGVGSGRELTDSEARRVRQSIARVSFMCQDGPDLCYASRVLSKHMSAPTDGTKDALLHVVKYLKTHRRCVNKFVASIAPCDMKLDVFSDSDWANDKASRKSCSGGTILLAGVPLSFWSKTQSNIALSSGEAELNSSVKAISESLGVIHLYDALFHERLETNVHVDSSACKGMLLRSGAGKVK